MSAGKLLLILFGYGLFLLVATYGIAWLIGRWQQSEDRSEQARRRTLDRVMQSSEPPYRAAGLDRVRYFTLGVDYRRDRNPTYKRPPMTAESEPCPDCYITDCIRMLCPKHVAALAKAEGRQ